MTIPLRAAFFLTVLKVQQERRVAGEITFPRGEALESTQALSHRKRFKYL